MHWGTGGRSHSAWSLHETCETLRISFTVDGAMSQQPQSWGMRAETHTKTPVNVSESVTLNLNLPQFQNQVASKIVPVVILELVGHTTKDSFSKGGLLFPLLSILHC